MRGLIIYYILRQSAATPGLFLSRDRIIGQALTFGVKMDRKIFYNRINMLKEFGLGIEYDSKSCGYRLVDDPIFKEEEKESASPPSLTVDEFLRLSELARIFGTWKDRCIVNKLRGVIDYDNS